MPSIHYPEGSGIYPLRKEPEICPGIALRVQGGPEAGNPKPNEFSELPDSGRSAKMIYEDKVILRTLFLMP